MRGPERYSTIRIIRDDDGKVRIRAAGRAVESSRTYPAGNIY